MKNMSILEIRPLLRTTAHLLDMGWKERRLRHAVERGVLHKLRRGVYIDGEVWSQLWPESRHRAEVIAAADGTGGQFVASYDSAAVVLGLALYRHVPAVVHATVDSGIRISSGARVFRHSEPLAADDIMVRDGIACTSLSRTTFDVMRSLSPEAAIACADASLGAAAVTRRVQDEHRAGLWREDLTRRVTDAKHGRGVRQARRMIELADGRAESPGESVSRLQLLRLGFATPRVQVPVPAPDGGWYWVDFGLDDVGALGEFDGKEKYVDEAKRRGQSMEQVILDEKRREDWIRGTTHRRFPRWGDEHIGSPQKLRQRLMSFHITPPLE